MRIQFDKSTKEARQDFLSMVGTTSVTEWVIGHDGTLLNKEPFFLRGGKQASGLSEGTWSEPSAKVAPRAASHSRSMPTIRASIKTTTGRFVP